MRIKSKKTIGIFLAVTTLVTGLFSQTPVMAKSEFEIVTDMGKKVLVKYNGTASKVKIPNGVEVVEGCAFENNKKIRAVIFPKTVKTIGGYAFSKCKNLQKVTLPRELKSISIGTFSDCESLKSIQLNEKLKKIDEYALMRIPNLKKITIAKGNKYFRVKNGVLYSKDMKRLYLYPPAKKGKKFTIPKKVISVGSAALSDSKYLEELIVKGETHFGESSCTDCKSLKKVVFNKPYGASPEFGDCKKLKTIILPEGVGYIGYNQFEDCESITSINLPSTIKSIGEGAFSGCKNLTNINLPEGLESIGKYGFFYCENLSTLDFPQSLKKIEKWAFTGCTKLEKPTLPDTVDVEEKAFDE